MAMDKTVLGTAIRTRIETLGGDPSIPNYAQIIWEAISDEIIKHLIANMEVEIPQNANVGITASGGITVPAVINSQGTNPSQTVKQGNGSIS